MVDKQLQMADQVIEEAVKEEKAVKAKGTAKENVREAKEHKEDKGADIREESDDSGMISALKMVAPGTPLREGLDSILRAKTGALIVIGNSAEVMALVEGDFLSM